MPSVQKILHHHSFTASQKADEKQQGSVSAPRLALKTLEEELDEQTKKKFEERYEEGYDVMDDALY